MTQPGELHLQAYFVKSSAAYDDAMATYADALEVVADAKTVLFEAKDRLREIEDENVVNGGSGVNTISPSMTATKRDAVLRLALRDSAVFQDARRALQKAERELDRAEALRDTAANRMAIERRRCDAYLAAANQRAAVLQAQPISRQ